MEPVQPGYKYFDTNLSHPVYTPGGVISLRTTGGVLPAIELHGVGVEPLQIDPEPWLLKRDQAVEVIWTAPTATSRSEIYVRVTVDQHGATPVQLTCVTPDDGALELPASLVTQLLDLGVTGFPNGLIQRRTVDSVSVGTGGCAQFTVSSPRQPTVNVDGVIPCDSPDDCPTGETCNLVSGLCE